MKNCFMDKDVQQEPEQSVANRVLATFIAAVQKEEALSEVAPRLKRLLLNGDTVNEASLRQAIFGGDL